MFKKLTDHIYVRSYERYTDRPNIGLIRGTKRSLLYDARNSAAHVTSMKLELVDSGLPLPDYVDLPSRTGQPTAIPGCSPAAAADRPSCR